MWAGTCLAVQIGTREAEYPGCCTTVENILTFLWQLWQTVLKGSRPI